jgi:tetratricopeptide (TPR) repeat protein
MIRQAWAAIRAVMSVAGARGGRVLSAVGAAAFAMLAAAGAALTHWRRPARRRRRRRRGLTVRDGCLALPDGRLPTVADIGSPVTIGVHRAVYVAQPRAAGAVPVTAGGWTDPGDDYPGAGGGAPGVPAYVPRCFDGDLAESVAAGGFVLLVGDSAAGKSRAAFEAIRANVPGHTLICPRDRSAIATAAAMTMNARWCVLWLDNLERFLGSGGLTADLAAQISGDDGEQAGPDGGHRVIVATIRTAEHERLTRYGDEDAGAQLSGDARQVVAMAQTIPVPRMFTADELDRARAREWEPRLAGVIARGGPHGITEHLAGGPAMLRTWERARAAAAGGDPAAEQDGACGAALVSAAVDIRRIGFASPLPRALLEQVHQHYLERPAPGSLGSAWAWATRRRLGGIALLRPAGPGLTEIFDYLVDAVQRRGGGFGGVPDAVAQAAIEAAGPADADSIGAAAYAEGRYELAEQAWRRACQAKAAGSGPGPDHPDTLATRGNLALALRGAGRLDEAEAEHRAVVEAMTRVLGADYPATLAGRGNLAGVLRAAGRLAEAEAEHRAVLKIMKRVLGRTHPGTLTCRGNIASLLHAQGRLEEAEAEHRAVLKAMNGALGPDHPDTLTSRNNLASVLYDMGRLEEAEAEHRAELEACARVLGPDHPDTLTSRVNLGGVLRALGRLEDAEAEYRSVLEAMTRLRGPGDPQTLASRGDVAAVLQARGRLEQAEAEHRAVLDGAVAALGPDHRASLAARGSLALVLYARGRLEEAETEHLAVAEAMTRTLGPDHRDTLTARGNLALVLYARGRLDEAEAENRAILEIMSRTLGPDDPDTLASRDNLAMVWRALGRLNEAEAEHRAVLESRMRLLGPDHPDTLASRSALAVIMRSRWRPGQAEEATDLVSVS